MNHRRMNGRSKTRETSGLMMVLVRLRWMGFILNAYFGSNRFLETVLVVYIAGHAHFGE